MLSEQANYITINVHKTPGRIHSDTYGVIKANTNCISQRTWIRYHKSISIVNYPSLLQFVSITESFEML